MCYNSLIFLIILLTYLLSTGVQAACPACESMGTQTSYCRTSSGEPARRNDFYQNIAPQDSFFTLLEKESLQKVEAIQNDPGFQEIVTELQNNSSQGQNGSVNSGPETQGDLREASLFDANLNEVSLYIFISFSMGEKALLNIAQDAKQFGATLVLRGFKEGSYLKTAQSLQNIIIKTGQGVIIDPELYTLFNITAVPTFVLAKPFNLNTAERIQTPIKWAPIHDKLQGHVSTHYALETFAKEGDLKTEANALLKRGVFK